MPRKTSPRKRSNGKPAEKPHASAAEPDRVTRPDLPRSEPIRSWTTLFGADSGPARAQSAYASGARTTANAVQRGVELGYRVIDDYLRQGSTAAGAFSAPIPQQAFPAADLPQMTERMLRSAQDMSSLWFEMMGAMMSNMPSAAANGVNTPPSTAWAPVGAASAGEGRAPGSGRWRVVVRVESSRPTEVTVTLDDGELATALSVEPLRAASGGAHIDATLEVAEEPARVMRLRASVATAIPADRYTGVVLDTGTGKPVGRVTIEVVA